MHLRSQPVAAEIERKFLVPTLPEAAARARTVRIEQGYVAIGERTEVRLRRASGWMTLTAKRGHGETREEHEIALYREQFEALWALTDDRQLVKTRRDLPLGEAGLTAELDVYEGALEGLIVVEVEFDSAERGRAFQPPEWFGEEVTGDPAYSNQRLASVGMPPHKSGANGKVQGVSKAYRLKRNEGAADGLRRVARGRAEKASERLEAIGDGDPAEAIHGARKDLKKVRAVLRLLRGELGGKRFRRENKRYRDAGRLLAASRDAEVKVQTLRELERRGGGEFPVGPSLAWYEALEADRDRVAAGQQAGGEEIEQALAAIEDGAREISRWRIGEDSWRLLEPGIGRSYRDGRKALKRTRSDGNAESVHELRKRVKDLWYELRLLHDAWPGMLEPAAEEAHVLADLLGDHHDLAVLAEDLDARTGVVASQAEFAALIAARQDELLAEALDLGERLYAEVPKQFRRRLRAYWRAWR
jgi:CYTH domain-containing protein/CHAD domain-containing protein